MKIIGRKDMLAARAKNISKVNESAERLRQLETYNISSHTNSILSDVYREKFEEAKYYLKNQEKISPWETPIITQEAKARGIAVKQLAEMIVSEREKWSKAMGKIEANRAKAKSQIETTEIIAEMEEIADNFHLMK